MVYLDSGGPQLVSIDLSRGSARVMADALLEAPSSSASAADVFVAPQREERQLVVKRPGAPGYTLVPMESPFGDVTLAPDGSAALCWFGPNSSGQLEGDVFQNANEIAVVRLHATPPSVGRRTLRSFGGAPSAVHMSPKSSSPAVPQVALVTSNSHVALVDLNQPLARDVSVPLTPLASGTSVSVAQVLFAEDTSQQPPLLWAFLRSPGTPDIYALQIRPTGGAGSPEESSLDVQLNVFYSGASPSDMAVVSTPDGPVVYTVNSTGRTLSRINPVSAEATSVSLPGLASSLWIARTAERTVALVAYINSGLTFHVVDLDAWGAKGAVKSYKIASPIRSALVVEGALQAVVTELGGGVSVVDLTSGGVTPFRAAGDVKGLVKPANLNELWIATQVDAEGYAVRLDLATLTTQALKLADVPLSIQLLSTGHAVVDHPTFGGMATIFQPGALDADTAELVAGHLFTRILNREGE
jgi:hypothetical protein